MTTHTTTKNNIFLIDVIHGLSSPLKTLSSKYFYDNRGDQIFQEIMHLDEYYLPECELEILQNQANELMSGFDYDEFDIVELGAGDGSKTVHFLEQVYQSNPNFTYVPLDISGDVLKTNKNLVKHKLPKLNVEPIQGDYFKTMANIESDRPKIIMFMGSTLGNYSKKGASRFLSNIKKYMGKKDRLFIGVDLMKNPKTILNAYNDSKGVTKTFNINLLMRINRELGADFNIEYFDHYATYNPINGICYSFLVSLIEQEVTIGDKSFLFDQGEVIHTEVSKKYDLNELEILALDAGFEEVEHHLDAKKYFTITSLK